MTATNTDLDTLRAILDQALTGRGAHVKARGALDGLDWQLSGERPEGAAQSIFQLVNHMVYWHEYGLAWLGGTKPKTPEHAEDSWPGTQTPASAEEWQESVERFEAGLAEFLEHVKTKDLFLESHKKTVLEVLQMIASHNSYHLGQIAQLRRMLGSWPPPGGGETW